MTGSRGLPAWLLAAAVALVLAACRNDTEAPPTAAAVQPVAAPDKTRLEAGRAIYNFRC